MESADIPLKRLVSLYETLIRCNSAIVHAGSTQSMFDEVCQITHESGGLTAAWIGMIDSTTNELVPVAYPSILTPLGKTIRVSLDADRAEGKGPTAEAVRSGAPVFCNDIREQLEFPLWRTLAHSFGVHASAALPLRANGRVVGVFSAYAPVAGFFDEPIQRLMLNLADDLSFALESAERIEQKSRAEAALRESEWRYRELFHSNPQAMWVFDRNTLQFLDVNEAAIWYYGYSKAEFMSMTLADIRPAEDVDRMRTTIREQGEGVHRPGLWRHRRKNGEIIIAEVVSHDLDFQGKPACLAICTDMTATLRVQQDVAESEDKFRSLVEQAIAGIYIIDADHVIYANPRFAEMCGYDAPEEMAGLALRTIVPEASWKTVQENIRLRLTGEVKSIQYVTRLRRRDGTEFDIEAHGSRANYQGRPVVIGVAQDVTERQHAREQITSYIEQLEKAMMSTIRVVSNMVELRDPYTSGHERRVGELASAIGRQMGLPPDRCKGLEIIGMVHDIGKISIPADILSKPSRLTLHEFELVKTHAQLGYDVLKGTQFPWPVAESVLQHHERLDGSGYPLGLKGDAIILEARIIAVADVMESMASHRPYRPALGVERALAEILEFRGSRYDPDVVDACVHLFRHKQYTWREPQ